MSQHPPTPPHPHPTDPNTHHDRGDARHIAGDAPEGATDYVPGDQPVPITVWRTAREPGENPHPIPRRLAYRLVAAYSCPGDAVIDLTPEHALAAAALAGARRHHKAWFTAASALIVGPSTTTTDPTDPVPAPDIATGAPVRAASTLAGSAGTSAAAHDDGPPVLDAEPLEAAAWFGSDLTDDLTDDLPPHDPRSDKGLRAATRLVVASWPLASGGPAAEANEVRLGWLLTACAQLLRPRGCLVLVVTAPAATATGATIRPEDFRPVIDAARAAGLGYLQHIVAVHADTDGDQFVYHATDDEILGLVTANPGNANAGNGGSGSGVPHLRVHADLIVLSYTAGNAASASGRRP